MIIFNINLSVIKKSIAAIFVLSGFLTLLRLDENFKVIHTKKQTLLVHSLNSTFTVDHSQAWLFIILYHDLFFICS